MCDMTYAAGSFESPIYYGSKWSRISWYRILSVTNSSTPNISIWTCLGLLDDFSNWSFKRTPIPVNVGPKDWSDGLIWDHKSSCFFLFRFSHSNLPISTGRLALFLGESTPLVEIDLQQTKTKKADANLDGNLKGVYPPNATSQIS